MDIYFDFVAIVNMEITKAANCHRDMFRRYVEICCHDNLALYQAAIDDPDAYLEKRIAYSFGQLLPAGWPPIMTYFCILSGEIVGSIRVRCGDNDKIENIVGHIGYETLPKVRGKGVATTMLKWVKSNMITGAMIITCQSKNIASKKVIEKCGGEYLNTFYDVEEGLDILRYRLMKKENK